MKKLLFLLLVSLYVPLQGIRGNEVITLSFSKRDFSFYRDSLGRVEVVSQRKSVTFAPDTRQPGLPKIPVNVAVPNGISYKSVSYTVSKKLVTRGVVAPNPQSYPTDSTGVQSSSAPVNYENATYPDSNVKYVCTSVVNGANIIRLEVCPFIYDHEKGELYLIERLDLNIETYRTSSVLASSGKIPNSELLNIFGSQITNKDSFLKTGESLKAYSDLVEYLIITNSSLYREFNTLVSWKKTKGVRTRVLTIESIDKKYPGKTRQEKIKRCIYDLYQNNGLKYVMLGGDDTIVPVQYCYSDMGRNDNMLPTDLYYACFGGCFDWDGNGNNICGETTDNIDFTPSVFLTRLPVRTAEDIVSYVGKLMSYEQNPVQGGWKNNMLSEGFRLSDNENSTDAEEKSDIIYNNYIREKWNGDRFKFFNGSNNLPNGAGYEFNTANIQEQFSKGYSFIDYLSHGAQDGWGTRYDYMYSCNESDKLKSNGLSIITTNSCHTNAFDCTETLSKDPCLSESFIRNPNSGVIAYLGCSREGWTCYSNNLGTSEQYTAQFYSNLFSNEIKDKNFGVVAALAKSYFIGSSKYYNSVRWVQLGLNPIGDPEMQIYTDMPKEFSNAKVEVVGINKIKVSTGVDDAKVCVMSCNDDGKTYYSVIENVCDTLFNNVEPSVTICLTKQNYRPKVFTIKSTHLQNTSVADGMSISSDVIYVGSSVTGKEQNGPVEFKSANAKLKAKAIFLQPDINISRDSNVELYNIK